MDDLQALNLSWVTYRHWVLVRPVLDCFVGPAFAVPPRNDGFIVIFMK
jgi:hypothetical protein